MKGCSPPPPGRPAEGRWKTERREKLPAKRQVMSKRAVGRVPTARAPARPPLVEEGEGGGNKKFFQALWASRLVASRVMPLSLLFSLSWTVSAWRDLVGGGARNEPFEGAPCSAEQFGFGSWMTSILDDGNRLLRRLRGCGEIRFSASTRATLDSPPPPAALQKAVGN